MFTTGVKMRFSSFFLCLFFCGHAVALDWQGHRGARGLYPENTIGSMREALKYPVTTLEMDVVVSKDHQVVVSHEPWMSEEICLGPEGKALRPLAHKIYQLKYDEIVKYDCGSKPHPRFPEQVRVSVGKPLLATLIDSMEETLKTLNRQNVEYSVEIKSSLADEKAGLQPDIKTFSELVIKTLQKKLPETRFLIQSFDWRVLRYIKEKYPKIRLVALTEKAVKPSEDLKELGFNPTVYSPYYQFLTESHVKFFHEREIKVIPWTVNEVSEMEALIKMGVDGIITDYPNRITQVGQKKCGRGENLFEGKCITLPRHAVPSSKNPGWDCRSGYIQKRSHCIKLKIPGHGHLDPGGKTWSCDEGYVRYRGTCKKSK